MEMDFCPCPVISNRNIRRLWIIPLLLAACQQQERPPLVIEVTGDDYYWHLRYPGPDGVLHTLDDVAAVSDLHVPAGEAVEVRLTSADFLYLFALPELGLSQVAVPDLWFSLSLQPDSERTYRLEGDQMCGFSHDSLLGTLYAHSRRDFEDWMRRAQAENEAQ